MIHLAALSVVFAAVWTAVTGAFTLPNVLFGLVLSLIALSLVRTQLTPEVGRVRPLKALSLFGLFVVELLKSGFRVARIVVRRDMGLKPGIVACPLTVTRDFDITLLANLITLTPGTLSVDVSDDRSVLYVHCVDMPDAEGVIVDIKSGFERKILETFA